MQGLCKAHNTTQRSIVVITFFVAKNRKVPSSCSSLLKAVMSPGKYLKWEKNEENNLGYHEKCTCDSVVELEPLAREKLKIVSLLSGGFRGRPRRVPPYGPKFSQFHPVFHKIWQNHMLPPPPRGLAPPPTGNPGSAPASNEPKALQEDRSEFNFAH